jgi:outer membrane protein insertion porin family
VKEEMIWLSLAAGLLGCAAAPGPAAPTEAAIPGAPAAPASPAPEEACSAAPAPAGSPEDFVVRVAVTGNQRTTRPEICDLIRTKAGHDLDRERLASDLRELFHSGLFDDAQATSQRLPGGRAITITVRERPRVKQWEVKAVGAAPPEEPLRELAGKPGDVFDAANLQARAESAREGLAAVGYLSARVAFHATPVAGNEVLVEVTVEAGPPQLIQEIRFPGASGVKESELLALLDTSQGKVNAPGGMYQQEALEYGILKVNSLYYERGMITVKVGEPEVTPIADRGPLRITVPIEEGPVYKLDKLRCVGDLAGTEKQCLALLGVKRGEIFRRSVIAAGVQRIHDAQAARQRGSVVDVATDLDPKAGRVNLKILVGR